MKRELRCDDVRVQLSARLDGELPPNVGDELDAHLEGCAACRRHLASLDRVRLALRLQPAPDVPDLIGPALERVRTGGIRTGGRNEWNVRLRIAAVAAAAAALVVAGTTAPWRERSGDLAQASEILRAVRNAARTLDSYRASFQITERGWHPRVPVRNFTAEISFVAPETLRMSIRDLTAYPTRGNWPRNDVTLAASARRWWIREPSTCPTAALPGCSVGNAFEERSVTRRRPFDGSTLLPTDVIVPLDSLADSESFAVLGRSSVAGREAYHVSLPYRHALPLVGALQPGGSWRSFHPLDRVDVWIDEDTWFPLRVEVRAGASVERSQWAESQSLGDRGGAVLLGITATSFSESPRATVSGVPRAAISRDGGFSARPFDIVAAGGPTPRYVGGLNEYRAGETVDGRRILSYANGLTWLRFESRAIAPGDASYSATAEEVRLPEGGFAYYEPADESLPRRLDLYGRDTQVHIESNLARSEMMTVAASAGIHGRRAPDVFEDGPGLRLKRVTPTRAASLHFVKTPSYLPPGYKLRVAHLSTAFGTSKTLTAYYRRDEFEYDGFGIRVTQSPSIEALPPSSEEFVEVSIDGKRGRWSSERGELEWIDQRIYRAVAVPTFDLATALRVAEGLR